MRYIPIFFILLTFSIAACVPSTRPSGTQAGVVSTQVGKMTVTPGDVSSPPLKGGKPPQTNAAKIIPPEQREELTQLSHLLKFKVLGWKGVALGQVSDFIINTCETYIIYFTVTPHKNLHMESANPVVIPFEVVTINSGALNAKARAISLYMTQKQVAAAPTFADHFPLIPYRTWEETVRAYWLQLARVSNLTSECKAGGSDSANAVHKIAYASQLIGAELKDGNHNLLGTVQDAVLEPESGKLGFYIIKLLDGSLVMAPLGQTNIPQDALEPGKTIELVLLAENNKLLDAPRIASVEQAMKTQTQSEARQYWKK